jgi:LuxR family quorum sensing-dependent transcriptional regulator
MGDDDREDGTCDRTFAFVDDLARLRSREAITTRLLAELKPFGLEVVMAAQLAPARIPTDDDILLNGWPPDWHARYRDEELFRRDPVAQFARRQNRPFIWSEVPGSVSDGFDPGGAFMGRAREHGLVDGFCLGVAEALGRRAVIGFGGSARLDLSPMERVRIETMALHAMRRAIDLAARPASGNPLTRRERETLYWIAAGQTFADTAAIMRISEATVTSHLSNVRRKLEAANTPQAVAIAVDEQLIGAPQPKLST